MATRKECAQHYFQAFQRETALWSQVKGRLPGSQGFDPDLWDAWIDAVCETTRAARAAREAYAGTKPSEPA